MRFFRDLPLGALFTLNDPKVIYVKKTFITAWVVQGVDDTRYIKIGYTELCKPMI